MNRILIIDDDVSLLKLFRIYFKMQGYHVLLASNGKDALSQMVEYRPQLVVTDIRMPEMDGLEFILNTRTMKRPIPVIAISGGSDGRRDNFLNQAKLFGAKKTFEKPIALDTLHQSIERLLLSPDEPKTCRSQIPNSMN